MLSELFLQENQAIYTTRHKTSCQSQWHWQVQLPSGGGASKSTGRALPESLRRNSCATFISLPIVFFHGALLLLKVCYVNNASIGEFSYQKVCISLILDS